MRVMSLVSLVLLGVAAAEPASGASVGLQQPTATFSQAGFAVSQAIDGLFSTPTSYNGWAIDPNEGVNQTAAFETQSNTGFAGGTQLTFTLDQRFYNPLNNPNDAASEHALGRFRLLVTTADRATFADGLSSGGDVGLPIIWTVLDPSSWSSANGKTLTKQGDFSLLVTANPNVPPQDIYTVVAFTNLIDITGFRLEALADLSLPYSGPGLQSANGNFVLAEFSVDAVAATPEPTTLLLWGTMATGLGFLLRRRA